LQEPIFILWLDIFLAIFLFKELVMIKVMSSMVMIGKCYFVHVKISIIGYPFNDGLV
jgi:hypothetical protein